jgi:hypothetical protein
VLIDDIRHTHEYADEPRRGGCDAAARRGALSYLATLLTLGSLRSGVVAGAKR